MGLIMDAMAGRRYKRDPELWGMAWWKPLYWALGFTCAMFLVSLAEIILFLRDIDDQEHSG
jgi:hypothetical protein